MYHSKTKHIDVKKHYIRDTIDAANTMVNKAHTLENPADVLTNPLCIIKFQYCLDLVSVVGA